MLPDSLDGEPLRRLSGTAADFGTTGDMCMIFCPGELQHLARIAGVPVEQLRWAIAGLESDDQVVILRAIRLPDARGGLVDAWVQLLGESGGSWSTTTRTIENRIVTVAINPLRDDYDGVQYLVAVGDVLFVYAGQSSLGEPDDAPLPAIVEALTQLPA